MRHRTLSVAVTSFLVLGSGASAADLRFSTWAGGEGLALLQQLAQEYAAKTGTNVKVEVTPFADYSRKLAVQIASGDAPDIGWVAERDVPTFIASNNLANLSALGKDASFNLNDFPTSSLALWKRGGNLYGIPFSNSPLVLFYNKDLFKQAGIADPLTQYAKGQWSYNDFQKSALSIKQKTGSSGARVMRIDPKAWAGGLLAVLWSNGGGVYDKNMKCNLNSPGSLQAFSLMQNMMFKDQSMPRPGDQTSFDGGKLGMYFDNISYAGQLKDAKFKWGIAPLPKGTAGRITQLGQAGYAVFSKGKNQAEAINFLKFLASKENMARTAKFFPPPRQSVLRSSAYLNANPAVPASALKTALISQLGSARVLQTDTNWLKANDAITGSLDQVFQPGANTKAILDRTCQTVDGL
ncbi:sugar ABC transporter substrate-binding protein (plasmid) [Deinococcus metallilatus]|uniref:Multiple sugar transport system substrate-binding protein n=1 Tax=Deinococcus metallilatus TaxID=1211322 RepID=A0AAJ5F5X3_9DEIO|nr:sugar ABC transporter substrate-binding protein [Deinococcus metallilatus]MBB5293492.1 multiple sugar transport system substrate-binding protein [Deinococcus metallilatus]QBY06574.1 sugar ABC transporter substrate-binding protein [Deinococcus metallilatus]RXJ17917.1 sugar ABC transporter substrate-binding protein [Deinococcus metallilatus]TLK32189.1 sugar ABC transporter substrate-binding protein [Deinococcus metallilatus]GMA15288.1 sugar ABC transporter substrate-binding protein [Deinococc